MDQSITTRYTNINCPLPATVTAYSTNRHSKFPNTPSTPVFIKQVHGNHVVNAALVTSDVEADASFATQPGVVCVVKTADCLPILVSDKAGTKVAAIHAGWRSLASGVIDNTCKALQGDMQHCVAWLGPAIGPNNFYVDEDVLENFAQHGWDLQQGFTKSGSKWLVDLYTLARINLRNCGFSEQNIYGSDLCTYAQPALFYSHRRSKDTGRMQHLIWIK